MENSTLGGSGQGNFPYLSGSDPSVEFSTLIFTGSLTAVLQVPTDLPFLAEGHYDKKYGPPT